MTQQLDVAPPAVCAGMLQPEVSQDFKNVFDRLERSKVFAYICLPADKLLQMEAPKSATWWSILMPANLISSRTPHRH